MSSDLLRTIDQIAGAYASPSGPGWDVLDTDGARHAMQDAAIRHPDRCTPAYLRAAARQGQYRYRKPRDPGPAMPVRPTADVVDEVHDRVDFWRAVAKLQPQYQQVISALLSGEDARGIQLMLGLASGTETNRVIGRAELALRRAYGPAR